MINILIADDHQVVAQGIKNILESESNINVVDVVDNGYDVLLSLEKHKVDLVLLDIDMPQMDGLECAKRIKEEKFPIKVAILSMHQEKAMISGLIDLGVKGYMIKTIPKTELILAINTIHDGGEYFNSDITKSLLSNQQDQEKHTTDLDHLTGREIEITKLIAEGMTNTQIGENLFISPKTVDAHRTNIMKKLGVHNVAGLVRFAFQSGLIK